MAFCSNCGENLDESGNFCSGCGSATVNQSDNYNVQSIVDEYGGNRILAVKRLASTSGLSLSKAKELVDAEHTRRKNATPKLSFKEQFKQQFKEASIKAQVAQQEKVEEKQYQKDRLKELKREHIAHCPKCKSTSLSAHKKGFGIGKAVVGTAISASTGLGLLGAVAGNKGAKKVRVTCMNCGKQFWAGK